MPLDTESAVGISLIRFGVDDILNTTELIDNEGNIDYNRIKLSLLLKSRHPKGLQVHCRAQLSIPQRCDRCGNDTQSAQISRVELYW